MRRVRCDVCPRGCALVPGTVGACKARGNKDGNIVPLGYGHVTSIAVDPVEKKPLARWRPGSTVLSLGSYGCNLRCPWCQNHRISQVGSDGVSWRELSPEELIRLAQKVRAEDDRMVGIAYTYNEPLVCWEYVCDASILAHEVGLANVLVSAGCVNAHIVHEVASLIDAANIDLKSLREDTYDMLGGDLHAVRDTIEALAAEPGCHLEVTTLVVPGINDTRSEMRELAAWLAGVDPSIVLHVSRFFPNWRMHDRGPTPVSTVYDLAEVAREHLAYVYTGNC